MASRLGLYNAAAIELGETIYSGLTEDRESRYMLDQVYGDVLELCIEAGQWNTAERVIQIDADASLTPGFGMTYVFSKPSDWIRTTGLGTAPVVNDAPLRRYEDDQRYWYADVTPLYVRYVSDDTDFGMNLGAWPATFTRFVVLSLADRVCKKVTQSESNKDRIAKDLKRAKRDAMSKDAMRDATRDPLPGSWVRSRWGSAYRYSNGGDGRA